MWSFHHRSAVENTAFFLVFPLAGFTPKAFCGLSFGASRKKASTVFHRLCHRKRLMLYFLEIPKKQPIKSPNHRAHQRKILRKSIYFQYIAKKQPCTLTEPFYSTAFPKPAVPLFSAHTKSL